MCSAPGSCVDMTTAIGITPAEQYSVTSVKYAAIGTWKTYSKEIWQLDSVHRLHRATRTEFNFSGLWTVKSCVTIVLWYWSSLTTAEDFG